MPDGLKWRVNESDKVELSAYRNALYIVDAVKKIGETLSRFIPQQKIVCAQCHAEISTNANYCNQCGHKIE